MCSLGELQKTVDMIIIQTIIELLADCYNQMAYIELGFEHTSYSYGYRKTLKKCNAQWNDISFKFNRVRGQQKRMVSDS